MYLDIKVDVNGRLYESPSTLADNINQQLNSTNVYSNNAINPNIQNGSAQTVELPALPGPLLKVKKVNGTSKDKGDNQKLWGNLCVRDMNKWISIHKVMRCDLAFNYNINFNNPNELLKLYQPCFLMPNGAIDNQVYYPRTTKSFEYTIAGLSGGHTYDDARDIYYTTLPQYFLVSWFPPADSGAYRNWTQYSNSFPYFPYKSKVDCLSTSRSEVPNVGYTQMAVEGDLIPDPTGVGILMTGLYNLSAIRTDVHHFKDNKNKDASIAFFSKYDASWQSKVRTDNLDNISFDDDSLSKQYNVGCYPVTMQAAPGPEFTYDLTDTYWKGYMSNLQPPVVNQKYDFYYHISAPSDDDHKQHGGYSVYIWTSTGNGAWEEDEDIYVYTANNMNVADGRDPLDGLTFDGNYPLDQMAAEGKNWVIFDVANDKRFAALLWDDKGDGTSTRMTMYYCEPGFNSTPQPYHPDDPPYHDFQPFGYPGEEMGGYYYDMQVTDMYVMSTDPNNIGYWQGPHTDAFDIEPTGINNKPASQLSNKDTVCAFMLYRDSATKNGDSWDISPDFALPGMHQGQFCVSASFMDNPAVWLVNATRYDDTTDYPTDSNHNTNFLAVGAVNPTFTWDNALSRCTFTNLHTPKTHDTGQGTPDEQQYFEGPGKNSNYLLNEENWGNCLLYKLGFDYENHQPTH
eukprot:INCI4988.7.p1 GENE.INCI4988.7~~INCI4988.7.p1  ORF type:complete len:682 (+),score=115.04 INCI4988.7:1219-3264(+)